MIEHTLSHLQLDPCRHTAQSSHVPHEAERQSKINRADGERQEMIAISEGEKTKRINEAEGRGVEIERLALATASGIRNIAAAISEPGGADAVSLRIAEQWIGEFGKLAKETNSMIVPTDMSNIAGSIAALTKVVKTVG